MSSTPPPGTPVQAEAASPSPVTSLNAKTARRQKLLMGSLGAFALVGGSWFILGGDERASDDPDAAQTIDTAGLINRDLANREFVATYSNRLDAVTREQKALKDAAVPRAEIEAELSALKAENRAMREDGEAAIDSISAENAELKSRLAAQSAPAAPSTPPPAYGPQAGGYDARALPGSPVPSGTSMGGDSGIAGPAEVKLMSFTSDKAGASGLRAVRPETPPVVVEDSPDYLPPNSYASARVIVGVDASAGVASQTDPLPVVLRITGPARSVMQNGKVLTTRIEGCIVNGAARGDLSSEKVYVKLARMTCDQPGGRVAVSEVKGFISFAGKSGVRGRVVSREGSLVSQALLAGIVGGFGRGFSANADSVFSGVTANTDGSRSSLSAGDILTGGLGQGAADAADTVSQYLIERAEQYQPVVEMPTGIDVEIVFLDGVYVRNSQ
ncbi:TraB/VirB10 family protein [Croceicoccus hydrothermalis]|uniref:TraB/VirB10 family protein n=1 Tax=Croceicoccus hydrothermalis TaxID=2867964 RepID=UPI001EFBFB33|nr:TraB/VirB10 family protein [Croceicoccus hydrothermalis]